jgi:hypothetical protein
MEATVALSPLENWGQEGFDATKLLSIGPVPAAMRLASDLPGSFQQPRAHHKQAAAPAAPKRREDRNPANQNPHASRAARAVADDAIGCEGCCRQGHTAAKCFSSRHPNWNTQHATVPWKNTAVAQEIRILANGDLGSLPSDGVQWLSKDKLWIGERS